MALTILKEAFTTDVSSILATARQRNGGAIEPVAIYRASGYRAEKQRNARRKSEFQRESFDLGVWIADCGFFLQIPNLKISISNLNERNFIYCG